MKKKLFRKLTKKVDYPIHDWVYEFANKLAYFPQGTREVGIGVANYLLDFPKESQIAKAVRDHLQELLNSGLFFNKSINMDELAENQGEKLLREFRFAAEATTKLYPLARLSDVPENLIVNEVFISDPRIMLYNIFLKSGGIQLPPEDDTLEMQVALICADQRNQLFLKIIPSDGQNFPDQECFLRRKVQKKLGLIEIPNEHQLNEKNIEIVFKRMTVWVLSDFVLKGSNGSDKYDYTAYDAEKNKNIKSRYSMPTEKNQGYGNAQVLIDHLHHLLNSLNAVETLVFLVRLTYRFQALYGSEAPEMIKGYIDTETGKVTQAGARALLYSLGYLKDKETHKANNYLKI